MVAPSSPPMSMLVDLLLLPPATPPATAPPTATPAVLPKPP